MLLEGDSHTGEFAEEQTPNPKPAHPGDRTLSVLAWV